MKKNHILWFIAILIVNSGWYFVSLQSASQEINRPGADFSGEREAEVASVIGNSVDYEIEHCFDSINGGVYNVSLKVESKSEVLYSWSGTTEDDCITYSSSTGEGTMLITTEIEIGAEATITLYTWPLKSALMPGIVLFSIATIVVAYGETIVRTLVKKKLEKIDAEKITAPPEVYSSNDSIWQEPVRPQ